MIAGTCSTSSRYRCSASCWSSSSAGLLPSRDVESSVPMERSAPERGGGLGEEAREQRDPLRNARDVAPLGGRVVVPADRAEAVERRHAGGGGRVGVRCASRRGIVELEAERA